MKRRWLLISAAAMVVAVLSVLAYAVWLRDDSDPTDTPLFVVQRGGLIISVIESGTIQSRDQVSVKSEVEGKAAILWLIPESTVVEADDLLVKLDSSRLEDEKAQQEIVVMNSEAAYVRARENLAVTSSQSESDVAEADLARKFAELDLKKYLEGEYPQLAQQADAEITIAREELQRASDKLEWSQRLAAQGYVTRTELQADELAAKRSQLNLELAQGKLKLLKDFTYQRSLEQLRSNVTQATKALDRVRRKVAADIVQADVDFKAKESEFKRQKAKLEKGIQQIAKCELLAPVAGMVVYATTGKTAGRGNVEPLAEGQEVRERQELIYLPTTSSVMVLAKVHESSLRKVRSGLSARVTVDAVPDKAFSGTVGKIGLLADAQSAWMNPDLKVYNTEINLEGDGGELRPGMTCRVEIFVEKYDDAVYVPVHSILRVGGKPVAYVQGPKGPEPREVEIGLDNNRMVRVLRGLQKGEKVLLAPPLDRSARDTGGEQEEARPGPAVPAAATQPAADGPTTRPTSRPALDPAKLRARPPEEGKKLLEGLGPPQQEKLKKESTKRGGNRKPGSGSPRAPAG